MKNIFLNDKTVLAVILANALIIIIQECGIDSLPLNIIDLACTLFFVIEISVKIAHYGRNYWRKGWNKFDFIVIALSLPSVLELFVPVWGGFEMLQVFRTLRIMKFFRTVRYFPDFSIIVKHFGIAMRKSIGILCSFLLLLIIVALVCTSLFKNIVPQYFGTIWDSLYTIFRMFTIEGWYEIPDAIASVSSTAIGGLSKIIFCILLVLGGIIGVSLINSIFVDEMVSDNNDDVKKQLNRIEQELREIKNQLRD